MTIKSFNQTNKNKYFQRNFIFAILIWSIISVSSLAWNIFHDRQDIMRLAHKDAIANFNKDQAFRFWSTSHGGVYVPIDKRTPNSLSLLCLVFLQVYLFAFQ